MPQGEIAPAGFWVWKERKDDEYSQLEQSYSAWIKEVAEFEELFAKHVHNNPDLQDTDIRQHRYTLCLLMMFGERIALDFLGLSDGSKNVASYLELIDDKVKGLRKEFIEWHTPVDFHDPVPDSFKVGMKEAAEGKLLEFPDAKD